MTNIVLRPSACLVCDTPIRPNEIGRPRRYCSHRCRIRAQVLGIQGTSKRKICAVDGCERPAVRNGWCNMHDLRVRKSGDPGEPNRRIRENGTGNINPRDGYVNITINGRKQGEHRWVMEQLLGRSLLPSENVHHKNGIRADNRPLNLELWSTSQPSGQRVADKLAWAREFVAQYGDIEQQLMV